MYCTAALRNRGVYDVFERDAQASRENRTSVVSYTMTVDHVMETVPTHFEWILQ